MADAAAVGAAAALGLGDAAERGGDGVEAGFDGGALGGWHAGGDGEVVDQLEQEYLGQRAAEVGYTVGDIVSGWSFARERLERGVG